MIRRKNIDKKTYHHIYSYIDNTFKGIFDIKEQEEMDGKR